MTIEHLAEQYELKITRDDCNDKIIAGPRGHLYVDEGVPCLMAMDTRHRASTTWQRLGGVVWIGDISLDAKGRKIEDVKIRGLVDVKGAIRLTGCRVRVQISEEERERRRKRMQEACRIQLNPVKNGLNSA